ncbi:TetR/AcrR family transcriptional regulator [bacterium]|nr:TetR/AcrR family transcriptional regulator [bacterium]
MAYRKSGATRDRILKAAAELFAERGYYEVAVGDIADRAGIGRPSFYYYFVDKEKAARALFDSFVERTLAAAEKATGDPGLGPMAPEAAAKKLSAEPRRFMLLTFVKYILIFKYVALNPATQAVYYDLVDYADYDAANIERLKRTVFRGSDTLAAAYGAPMSESDFTAYIVTSNAIAKSLFKAVLRGILGYGLEEAMDGFVRKAILPAIPMPEDEYRATLAEAFGVCAAIEIG